MISHLYMSKGSANEPSISDSDDDSVSELFDGVDNLTLVDQADGHRNGDDASSTFTSSPHAVNNENSRGNIERVGPNNIR